MKKGIIALVTAIAAVLLVGAPSTGASIKPAPNCGNAVVHNGCKPKPKPCKAKGHNRCKPPHNPPPAPPPPPVTPPPPAGEYCDGNPPENPAGKDGQEGNNDCLEAPQPPPPPPAVLPAVSPPASPSAPPAPPVPVPAPKPKPKPKPPAPKPVCVKVEVSTKVFKADGKVRLLAVRVGNLNTKVSISGAGIQQTERSKNGYVVFRIVPKKEGIIVVRAGGACSPARVGVTVPKTETVTG